MPNTKICWDYIAFPNCTEGSMLSCTQVQLLWAWLISPLVSLSGAQNGVSRSAPDRDPSGPLLALEPFCRRPSERRLLHTTSAGTGPQGQLPDFRAVFLGLDHRQFPTVAPNDAFPQSFTPKCERDSSSTASKGQECFSVSCFSCVPGVKWIEGG